MNGGSTSTFSVKWIPDTCLSYNQKKKVMKNNCTYHGYRSAANIEHTTAI